MLVKPGSSSFTDYPIIYGVFLIYYTVVSAMKTCRASVCGNISVTPAPVDAKRESMIFPSMLSLVGTYL